MKKTTISLLLSLPLFCANLSVDPYYSPYMGANLIETTTETLIKLEDSLKFEPNGWAQQSGAGFYRFATASLFWAPYGRFTNVVQHEVFGHGYRIRSLKKWGFKTTSYYFDPPSIYGSRGGATSFIAPSNCSVTGMNSIDFGGTEGQTVLAMRLRETFFQNGVQDGRYTSLYGNANFGLTRYIARYDALVNHSMKIEEGNDIGDYLESINALNPQAPITKEQLFETSLITFLDPFFWGQFISYFTYVLFGKEYPTPTITWNSLRFTPSFSPNLTPFGPEIIFEQYLSIGTIPFKTYCRYTPLNNHGIYGIGFKHLYLTQIDEFHLGCIVDAWVSPPFSKLTTDQEPFISSQKLRPGVQAMITIRQAIEDKENFQFGVDLGFKTSGYLIGAPLQAGFAGQALIAMEF